MPRRKLGSLKKVKIQWFVTPPQEDKVVRDAAARGVTPSEMIRIIIEEYYSRNKSRAEE